MSASHHGIDNRQVKFFSKSFADLVLVAYHRKKCHRWQYLVVLFGKSGIGVNIDRKTGAGDGSDQIATQTEIPDRLRSYKG